MFSIILWMFLVSLLFFGRVACGAGVTEMEVHALLDQYKKFSQVPGLIDSLIDIYIMYLY